jgi:NAD(P)-dependent dehydrogenase (short-subunit alcohol dehydrogenase family)
MENNDMVEPRTAVITGGSSGIGRAAAKGLVAAGFAVAICGRDPQKLESAQQESGAAFAANCDVGDPEAVARFFAFVREEFGRIDVVFNNAGISAAAASFGDIEVETWRRMIDTNLNGAFFVAREAFRQMRAQDPQGGRIINNGSISAYAPRYGAAPYTASKHAITGLTKSISLDGRQFNIACGQIDIGNTATDMTRTMGQGMMQADGTIRPEPTFDVHHVVDAVVYMANLPLDVNVQFMTVMATTMPYVGRG